MFFYLFLFCLFRKSKTYIIIYNIKITQFIAALSPLEQKKLQLWLSTAFNNSNTEVLKLYEYFCEYIHFIGHIPTKEKLYARLFPQQVYDDQLFRSLCSQLFKKSELFVQQNYAGQNEAIALLSFYRKKNLGKLFENYYKQALKKLNTSSYRDLAYYWERYYLARERYNWDAARGRSGALNLEEQEQLLHIATIGAKLKQACLSLAHQQTSGLQYAIPMLNIFIAESQASPYANIGMLRVYRRIVELYQSEEQGSFAAFTKDIVNYINIFPKEEARDLLLLAINFGVRNINKGQQEALEQTLLLYQKALEGDLLIEKGKINVFTYNNIAGIAIRLNELDWAEHFINTYKKRLDRKKRQSVYALNAARLAYSQKEYLIALNHLKATNDRDFIHLMSAKTLELKIYVDTQDYEQSLKHIRNTKAFLKRNKQNTYHVKNYYNILNLTEQYHKLQIYDKQALAQWKSEVENTAPLTERSWLLSLLDY